LIQPKLPLRIQVAAAAATVAKKKGLVKLETIEETPDANPNSASSTKLTANALNILGDIWSSEHLGQTTPLPSFREDENGEQQVIMYSPTGDGVVLEELDLVDLPVDMIPEETIVRLLEGLPPSKDVAPKIAAKIAASTANISAPPLLRGRTINLDFAELPPALQTLRLERGSMTNAGPRIAPPQDMTFSPENSNAGADFVSSTVLHCLERFGNIEELSLAGMTKFTGADLAAAVAKMPRLRTLNLSRCIRVS
jgi:hypothetical protein